MFIFLIFQKSKQGFKKAINCHLFTLYAFQFQLANCDRKLKKEMAMHSRILVYEIPWIEESGGLQSMGSQSQT